MTTTGPCDVSGARIEELLVALSAAVEAQGLRFEAQLQQILGQLQDGDRSVDQRRGGALLLAERQVPLFPETEPQQPVNLEHKRTQNWESTPTQMSEGNNGTDALVAIPPKLFFNDQDEDISALALAKGWMSRQAQKTNIAKHPWLWQEWAPVANLVRVSVFEYGVAILILSNALMVGIETDRQLQNFGVLTAADAMSAYLQDVCTVLFCLELLLRLLAYRLLLFTRHDANWNLFDIICVSLGMIELVTTSVSSQGSLVRTMRIPRVLRVLRVFRLSRFFREIRLMMYMIVCSFRSLFWTLMLLVLLVYIVGVSLARFVVTYMQDVSSTDLESVGIEGIDYFASVPTCMLTLVKAAFGGDDWGQYLDVLQLVGVEAATLFLVYMACMLMAILNVITGVFVDHTMQSVRKDEDLAITEELLEQESTVNHLKHLFQQVVQENQPMHTTGSNPEKASDCVIDEETFYKIIMHEDVRAYFAVLGLDASHAQGLYKLLDMNGDGQVGMEEFVLGCLRLKGEAKAVDLATLMYENKRIIKRLNHMNKHHSNELCRFYEAIHVELSSLGKRPLVVGHI